MDETSNTIRKYFTIGRVSEITIRTGDMRLRLRFGSVVGSTGLGGGRLAIVWSEVASGPAGIRLRPLFQHR